MRSSLRPDLRRAPIGVLIVIAALAAACEREEPPVGRLTVQPGAVTLEYPSYAALEFSVQMTQPLGGSQRPIVFVHLVDDSGSVVRTYDHPFPEDWRPGEEVRYEIVVLQSALAPPLPAGEYVLTAGIYRGDRRWALVVDGREVDDHEYQVATVSVPAEGAPAPMFNFSPSWMPTEAGTDAQVLGRRWLSSAGVIRLAQIRTPGTLRLALRLPPPKEGEEDLVLAEGHAEPGARVESGCGGEAFTLSGLGEQVVEVPVRAGADGALPATCEIRFEPFSQLVEKRTMQTRAVLLEALSWKAE